MGSTTVQFNPDDVKVVPFDSDSDLYSFCEIEDTAFGTTSELIQILWGLDSEKETTPEDEKAAVEFSVNLQRQLWKEDHTTRFTKAVLPDGKIVGVGRWSFFLDPEHDNQWGWPRDFGPSSNKPMCDWFIGELSNKRIEYMKGKKNALMALLAVHPQYQRRGIGKKLLAWGLDQADEQGFEVWIDATPEGLGLYKKVGWEEVSYVDADLERWGGEKYKGKFSRTVNLVRKPKSH